MLEAFEIFKGLYSTIKIGALVQIWFWYRADIEGSKSLVLLLFGFKAIITGQDQPQIPH